MPLNLTFSAFFTQIARTAYFYRVCIAVVVFYQIFTVLNIINVKNKRLKN